MVLEIQNLVKVMLLYNYEHLILCANDSYGGMLAAWFRFKYPNVVDGALAASAPIFYIDEGLVSRTAFFQKVTEVRPISTSLSSSWELINEAVNH